MIETDRLLLRPPRVEDAAALLDAYSDHAVMEYIGDGTTFDLATTHDWIRKAIGRWAADGFGHFAVERRDDGLVIGRVGFLVWDSEGWRPGTRAAFGERSAVELGWIVAREHWGRDTRPKPPPRAVTTPSESSA